MYGWTWEDPLWYSVEHFITSYFVYDCSYIMYVQPNNMVNIYIQFLVNTGVYLYVVNLIA